MEKYVFDPRLQPRTLRPRRHIRGVLIAAVALITGGIFWPSAPPPGVTTQMDAIGTWLHTGPQDRPVQNATLADISGPLATSTPGSSPNAAAGQDPETPSSLAVAAAQTAPAGLVEAIASTADAVEPVAAEAVRSTEPDANADTPEDRPANPAVADRAESSGTDKDTAEVADVEEDTRALPSRWHSHTVGKGDTLAKVLKNVGIEREDRAKILVAAKEAKELAQLKVGQTIRAKVDTDGSLLELQVKLDAKSSLHVELDDDDYRIHEIDRPVEKRVSRASATIQSSLFSDGQEAGLSDAQIMELAAIFGWDIDFALNLRAGDRFSVIYEAEYVDGKKVDDGAILAAEFVNQGKTYRALRFEDDDGTLGYYAPDGTSKKQAFLRTPIKLARVSSGFSLSRMHPILQTRRAHKGVDYSAPTGTPVKATGSGLVKFSGQKNGYGNVVELQHGDTYTTLYGHLSRFAQGMRIGATVKQGEVIGYVGQTGLATGPHLHYEFRVAGEHRDPLSTKLPTAVPLTAKELSVFRRKAAPLLAQLDLLDRTMVARAQ